VKWCYDKGAHYIQPGEAQENGKIESVTGSLRDECLKAHWFTSLEEAAELIEMWREEYKTIRPHSRAAQPQMKCQAIV
jgi:putative transposase